MDTILKQTQPASNVVNAVCIEVEDLGVIDTPYGDKPQVKFAFESDACDDYGDQRRFVRIFNKYFNSKSALSMAVKSWCGRDLAAENENLGEVDLQSFVGYQAQLKLEPITTKSGRPFDKIVDITTPGAVHVQPRNREARD